MSERSLPLPWSRAIIMITTAVSAVCFRYFIPSVMSSIIPHYALVLMALIRHSPPSVSGPEPEADCHG
jgi:hypothetical protein